jgi:putative molybdopterin biosynthesis protein
MRLRPILAWQLGTEPAEVLDARLAPLLDAVQSTGSLAAAVRACGLSYRAAWGLLRDYERKLGAPLAVLERGRGARLAPAAVKLISGQRAAQDRLARLLSGLTIELGGRAAQEFPAADRRLAIAASHDLALAALRDALPAAAGLKVDIAFMASLQALEQFAAGRVDLGGFHVAPNLRGGDLAPFRRLLRARYDRLIRLVDRDQGFILPRGNPARIRSFADLARKRLRFINRQRGSGTRLLIDRLLATAGIDPARLVGYENEEFTHAAIAATVASGAADAGFGLRAVAASYGLAFVPRVSEPYYLAVRTTALPMPAIARLIEMLRGNAFARIIARLPGYRCEGAGTLVPVEALGR